MDKIPIPDAGVTKRHLAGKWGMIPQAIYAAVDKKGKPLSHAEKTLLAYLYMHLPSDYPSWFKHSQGLAAKRLSISRRTVNRAVHSLRRKAFVKTKLNGLGKSLSFQLTMNLRFELGWESGESVK